MKNRAWPEVSQMTPWVGEGNCVCWVRDQNFPYDPILHYYYA